MLCVAEKHIAFTTKKWFYNIRTLKLNWNAFSRQKKNPFPTIHPFYQQKKKFSNFSNYIITPISKSSPIKKKKKTYIHPVTITTDSSIPNLPIILVSFTIFQHNDFPPSLCTPRVEPPAAAHAQLTAMRQPWGNDCNTIYYDTPHPPHPARNQNKLYATHRLCERNFDSASLLMRLFLRPSSMAEAATSMAACCVVARRPLHEGMKRNFSPSSSLGGPSFFSIFLFSLVSLSGWEISALSSRHRSHIVYQSINPVSLSDEGAVLLADPKTVVDGSSTTMALYRHAHRNAVFIFFVFFVFFVFFFFFCSARLSGGRNTCDRSPLARDILVSNTLTVADILRWGG